MSDTKTRILEAALDLFNTQGVVNVRLQHIADQAGISVGNLAYHFKHKERIVEALYQDLSGQLRQLMQEFRVVPLFELWDRQMRQTFRFQAAHRFFFLDTLEVLRAYPGIAQAHRAYLQWQQEQLCQSLVFNAARGALISPPTPDTYAQLAEHLRAAQDGWFARRIICGDDPHDEDAYCITCWSLIRPYFTPMGAREHDQIHMQLYGKDW